MDDELGQEGFPRMISGASHFLRPELPSCFSPNSLDKKQGYFPVSLWLSCFPVPLWSMTVRQGSS